MDRRKRLIVVKMMATMCVASFGVFIVYYMTSGGYVAVQTRTVTLSPASPDPAVAPEWEASPRPRAPYIASEPPHPGEASPGADDTHGNEEDVLAAPPESETITIPVRPYTPTWGEIARKGVNDSMPVAFGLINMFIAWRARKKWKMVEDA